MRQVTIPMDSSDLNDNDWRILEVLHEDGKLTAQLIQDRTNISKSTFYYRLRGLMGGDFVEKLDHGFYQLGSDAPTDKIKNNTREG